MTTIDYKEKYEQALERARQFSEKPYLEDSAGIVGYIFPELKESGDEKIRKALMQNLKERFGTKGNMGEGLDMPDVLAWFEKQGKITKEWSEMKFNNIQRELQEMVDLKLKTEQGEQKPAWSEEDEMFVHGLIRGLSAKRDIHGHTTFSSDCIDITETINWLKSLKDRVQPKQEWNEEDENRVNRLIAYFEDKESFTAEDDIVYANWLKSLRPQNTWKPSESDILLLERIANGESNPQDFQASLGGLIGQLKKLREE